MKSKGMTLEREFKKLKKKLQEVVGILDYTHHTFFVLSLGKNDRRLIYQHNNNTLKSHMILIRCFSIILPIDKQKVTKYVMQRIERCNFTGELGVFHIFSLF